MAKNNILFSFIDWKNNKKIDFTFKKQLKKAYSRRFKDENEKDYDWQIIQDRNADFSEVLELIKDWEKFGYLKAIVRINDESYLISEYSSKKHNKLMNIAVEKAQEIILSVLKDKDIYQFSTGDKTPYEKKIEEIEKSMEF